MRSFDLFLLLIPALLYSQKLQPNEVQIFSFETTGGKKMQLVKDKSGKYIQYRFGNGNKTELNFPATQNADSWKKFRFNAYERGGGKENSGIIMHYLNFQNKGFDYTVYYKFSTEDELINSGITVKNLRNGKITEIKAKNSTIKGIMHQLSEKIAESENWSY